MSESASILSRSPLDAAGLEAVAAVALTDRFKGKKWAVPDDLGQFWAEEAAVRSRVVPTAENGVAPWDLLPLLRNAPTARSMGKGYLVEVKEALVAASLLVQAEEPEDRVKVAWRICGSKEMRRNADEELADMGFREFEEFIGRLVRTGHFQSSSLLRKTEYFPPRYEILSVQGVAEFFFEKLGLGKEEGRMGFTAFVDLLKDKEVQKMANVWYFDQALFKSVVKTPKKKQEEIEPIQQIDNASQEKKS